MPFYLFNFKSRAIINYIFILFLFSIDISLSLSNTTLVCAKILGILLLFLTLMTNFKYSFINVLSMKTIQIIEFILTIIIISIPLFLMYKLEIKDIIFFLCAGTVLVIISTFTNCENCDKAH